MTRTHLVLGLAVVLTIAGCKASPTQSRLRMAGGLPGPEASNAPATPAPNATTVGLLGVAEAPGGVMAGAELKIYKPGQAAPIATGKTRADGQFVVDLAGKAVPNGALLKVVATSGGKSLAGIVSVGSMQLVGNDGATLVGGGMAVKPSNLIGMDGSTLIGQDGSTLVGNDGSTLVAAGAGNYKLLAAPPRGEARLSVATTIAVAVLGKRLDGALGAAYAGDKMVEGAVDQVMAAYDQFAAASQKSLEGDGADALIERVLAGVGDDGAIDLPADLAQDLADLSGELKTAFVTAAEALGEAIAAAAQGGGKAGGGLDAATFGDAKADAIDLPDPAPGTGTGGDAGGQPTGGDGGSTGGGSSGDDGVFGEDGAEEDDEETDLSDGTVTVTGSFTPPSPSPTPVGNPAL